MTTESRLGALEGRTDEHAEAIAGLRDDLRQGLADVWSEIRNNNERIDGLRADVRTEIRDVRGEIEGVRGEISNVRGEIEGVRTEIRNTNARIDALDTSINTRIGELNTRMERLLLAMLSVGVTLAVAQVGVVVAVVLRTNAA